MRMPWVRCLLFVIVMCFAASSNGVEAISTNCSAIKGKFVHMCYLHILPFVFSSCNFYVIEYLVFCRGARLHQPLPLIRDLGDIIE